MVNERLGSSNWQDTKELGETWASRNSFSYGKGQDKGVSREKNLQGLLGTTDLIVQEIDSVEYGLTDIQEYYANTGAMKKAAENARSLRVMEVHLRLAREQLYYWDGEVLQVSQKTGSIMVR
mmetsp:Transcript_5445/g.10023  ORF Transcript_5445/g.10023 Transcript_5445/m.10023 type:complete len:122 (-) Transcript_5445:421-786(-)